MAENILRTEKLSVGYGKKVIISGINISVERGEIVSIIGANGCGKSTILKTITSQLPGILGDVFIGGKNLREIGSKELSRTVSIMMTNRIDTELMTCYDVVRTGRYPYTGQLGVLSENDKNQIAEAMKMTSTEELADVDFSRISDGQRQRVMLARAVCQEPDLLVLDEPTSFLDIRHKLELLSMLKKLVIEKNIGVLMSMHELDLAEKISDKVVCVKDGKIDKCTAPQDIFTDEYIKELFGISDELYNIINSNST